MSRLLRYLAPSFSFRRARFICGCCLLAVLAAPGVSAGLLFHDDFRASPEGEAPTGWEGKDRWRVRHIGNEVVAAQEDESSGMGRPLTKKLAAPLEGSWVLEVDHAWAWGGSTSGHGFHSQHFDIDVTTEAGLGFRLRMPQGRYLGGPDMDLAATDKLWKLYRLERRKAPVLLATGTGHDSPGWRSRSQPSPEWLGACLAWDRVERRLAVLRRAGGRWVESITMTDIDASGIGRLTVNPSAFAHGCTPQIGRVSLWTPDKFAWGVTGEADGAPGSIYRALGAPAALAKVRQLGLGYYRVDATAAFLRPASAGDLDETVAQAREQGVVVLPVLRCAEEMTGSPPELYEKSRRRALDFAQKYRGRFTHVEIGRDLELHTFAVNDAADAPVMHDETRLARALEVLRGVCDGLRAGDPALRRLVGVVASERSAFLERAARGGVSFDGLALAWYSDMGSMREPLQRLSAQDKPIWITELNRTHGASRGLWDADGLAGTARGKPPEGWQVSGDWRTYYFGGLPVATNRDQSAGAGRTLTKVFARSVEESWSLELRSGWEWGDGGGANGNHAIWIDFDMVNAAGHGYRLRAHQGHGGKADNVDRVLRLFLLSASGAKEIAHGPGPNNSGWKSRRLQAPDLARLSIDWDKQTRRITVRHGEAGQESTAFSADLAGDHPARFDRLVVRGAMFNTGEGPQLATMRLWVDDRVTGEAQQAEALTSMIEELEGFPSVQGVVLHELFDRAPAGQSRDPGDYYGLFRVRQEAGGAYAVESDRPATRLLDRWIARSERPPALLGASAGMPGDLVPVPILSAKALDAGDTDGLPVLVKLAAGLPVGVPGRVSQVSLEDGRLSLEFTRRWPAQIRYQIEASSDGGDWTPTAVLEFGSDTWRGSAGVFESGNGPVRKVRVSDVIPASSAASRLLRLRVGAGEAATEPQGSVTRKTPEGRAEIALVQGRP